MGQYWLPVNLDKKEFIDPHKLGSGLKLWEQVANAPGVGAALIILTAAMPEARGGGDLDMDVGEGVIGRWAGDRIAIVGDYAEDDDLAPEHKASTIYGRCRNYDAEGNKTPEPGEFTDITDQVVAVIEHELDGKFEGTGWKTWKPNQ